VTVWLEAGFWGLVAGSALVLGAAIAWIWKIPRTVTAAVMAFGAGVLISTLAFDLVEEAEAIGGIRPTALGLLGGAAAYIVANIVVNKRGAQHRKRSDDSQMSEEEQPGSGTAIAIGALLDGVPESIVLGMSLIGGAGVGVPVLAGIFISNLPEGLSSTSGMKANGRGARYVFGVWTVIAAACGVAALLGCVAFEGASPQTVALINSVAAGAILAMIADTMIPEAYQESAHKYQLWTGFITVLGFITAFAISSSGA
jgi:ZIP family zinc transporter